MLACSSRSLGIAAIDSWLKDLELMCSNTSPYAACVHEQMLVHEQTK